MRALETSSTIESGPLDATRWTAVIPAAGRGSRLGSSAPKVLFPLLGRPLLDWVLDALETTCGRAVLVLAPGAEAASERLRERLGAAGRVVIQERPTGMADAVLLAEQAVETPNTLVVWGDQALVRARTVRACASLHERRPGALLTIPTVVRADPYIVFERDAAQRLVAVRQAREGEVAVTQGESDCGLFLFSSASLFSILRAARAEGAAQGRATGEFNLLPLLPRFEQGPGTVATVRVEDASEAQGVNTPAEARAAEARLRARRAQEPA